MHAYLKVGVAWDRGQGNYVLANVRVIFIQRILRRIIKLMSINIGMTEWPVIY